MYQPQPIIPTYRSRVELQTAADIRFWTTELEVSEDDLRRAIERVGHSIAAVRRFLERQASLS